MTYSFHSPFDRHIQGGWTYPDESQYCALCGGAELALKRENITFKRRQRFEVLMGVLQRARLEGMTHKTWVSARDPKVRPSHMLANGQRVPIDVYFNIGNERLFLPADPGASYTETANCRCSVKFSSDLPPIPRKGEVPPVNSNFGGAQNYNFVAGRYVRVEVTTANGMPSQFSGFRIKGFANPLERDGSLAPTIGPIRNQPQFNDGGHVWPFMTATRVYDAGFERVFGFRWKLECGPATASDNQGPVFFRVFRAG